MLLRIGHFGLGYKAPITGTTDPFANENILSRVEADYASNTTETMSIEFSTSDIDTANDKLAITSSGFEYYAYYAMTPVYFSSTGTLPSALAADTPYLVRETTGGLTVYPYNTDADWNTVSGHIEGQSVLPATDFEFEENAISFSDQGSGTHTMYTKKLASRMQDMTDNDNSAAELDPGNPNTYVEMDSDGYGEYFAPQGHTSHKLSITTSSVYGELMGFAGTKADLGAALSGQRYVYSVFVARLKPKRHYEPLISWLTPSDVTAGTGVFYRINHGLSTGDIVSNDANEGGSVPTGMPAGDSYARKVDNNRFTLHPTDTDATNNTNTYTFSDTGSGMFWVRAKQIARTAGLSQYIYDVNWPAGGQHMLAPSVEIITKVMNMSSSSYIFATSGGNMGYIWNSISTAYLPDGGVRKVNVWMTPDAVGPNCTDTDLPLESGTYWATSNGSFIKLHRTEALAEAHKNDTASACSASQCIKYDARGEGIAYITIEDEVLLTNFAMRSDSHTKTFIADDTLAVFQMMIDFTPDDADNPRLYVGMNGEWNIINGEESIYETKQLIPSGSLAEIKYFNASEPHVAGAHHLYANVVATSSSDPTTHVNQIVSAYRSKYGI